MNSGEVEPSELKSFRSSMYASVIVECVCVEIVEEQIGSG